jgi:hypothetical protein
MNAPNVLRIARPFALLVGGMDLLTGLALLIAPAITLARMGATPVAGETIAFVRFVGVFVAAVGATYLWAVAANDALRLRVALVITLFFRAGAGLYSSAMVAGGGFGHAWLIVSGTDLGCVGVQAWLLAKGVGRDA